MMACLKQNLPLLTAAVRARFDSQPAQAVFQEGDDRVEVWDDDNFDPWETLVVENGAVPGFGLPGRGWDDPSRAAGVARDGKNGKNSSKRCGWMYNRYRPGW